VSGSPGRSPERSGVAKACRLPTRGAKARDCQCYVALQFVGAHGALSRPDQARRPPTRADITDVSPALRVDKDAGQNCGRRELGFTGPSARTAGAIFASKQKAEPRCAMETISAARLAPWSKTTPRARLSPA